MEIIKNVSAGLSVFFPKRIGIAKLINSPEIPEANDTSLNILSFQN